LREARALQEVFKKPSLLSCFFNDEKAAERRVRGNLSNGDVLCDLSRKIS
jgi:hypothetical protein